MSMQIKRKLTSTTILFGLSALVLAGCSSDQSTEEYLAEVAARWQQIDAPPVNTVETVTFEHVVDFPSISTQPDDPERRRLHDFVVVSNLTAADTIILEGARNDSGTYSNRTEGQIAVLRDELADLGLPSFTAAPTAVSRTRAQDQVVIVVTRSVAVIPDCDAQHDIGDRPDYALGCTNNAALGLMVADPRDLNKGRSLDPADGEKASLALQRYRQDKEEKIQREATE
ncbi:MAG: CpaD family pilus assembly lipoprotein [Pseudomonadota bacterium]